MKSRYDGYVHENGTVQVKRMPFDASLIDISSPFVKRYLNEVEADSFEEAQRMLEARWEALK